MMNDEFTQLNPHLKQAIEDIGNLDSYYSCLEYAKDLSKYDDSDPDIDFTLGLRFYHRKRFEFLKEMRRVEREHDPIKHAKRIFETEDLDDAWRSNYERTSKSEMIGLLDDYSLESHMRRVYSHLYDA